MAIGLAMNNLTPLRYHTSLVLSLLYIEYPITGAAPSDKDEMFYISVAVPLRVSQFRMLCYKLWFVAV
jgi:hypothetical protein